MYDTPFTCFSLGEVTISERVREILAEEGGQAEGYLARHALGDWGEFVHSGDAAVNEQAARGMGPILSAYRTPSGAEIWVYTSDDHSHTEMILPEEFGVGR